MTAPAKAAPMREDEACPTCSGTGTVENQFMESVSMDPNVPYNPLRTVSCPDCEGAGKANTDGHHTYSKGEDVIRLRETLTWYGEQARLARLIHREGDAGRNALAEDGGKRAAAALAGVPANV